MSDVLIKSLPNAVALTSSPAQLDVLLLEQYQSGGDTSNPANNTYISKNIFVRDFLAGISGVNANKIINGGMVLDQRNAGASITPTASAYCVDRWQGGLTVSSKYSIQQDQGAVTPPVGFSHYLGATSLSAYSVGATDVFNVAQFIEGLNIADLNWGSANAVAVTLSFWVRSSLTGTFGGSLRNSGGSRSYPFTYTINVANTWEQKTVNIAGDTSGTWLTTNGIGIQVGFALGAGSTFSGSAGAWAGANYASATGAVSVVGTNGATIKFTGVKLEIGSVATPYVEDIYSVLLDKCQRYLQKFGGASNADRLGTIAMEFSSSDAQNMQPLLTTMRATPSVSIANIANVNVTEFSGTFSVPTVLGSNGTSTKMLGLEWTVSGLTGSGAAARVSGDGTSTRPVITADAEL